MQDNNVVARYVSNTTYGYVKVRLTDGTIVLEHRYIMELSIGRPLSPGEVVHHLDGNRANNVISNLEVLQAKEHFFLHAAQRVLPLKELTCANCEKKFFRSANYVRTKVRGGQNAFYCSRACSTPHTRRTYTLKCGEYGMYRKGCRCQDCRAANTLRMKKYYLTK